MIYYSGKQFPHDFIFSVSSFKSYSIEHGVHFVSYGPIYSKTDDKVGNDLERGFLVIDMSLSVSLSRTHLVHVTQIKLSN